MGIPAALLTSLLVIVRFAQASWLLLASILSGLAINAAAVAG